MARDKDRRKAIEFRKKGMSYSQIKNKLDVSKSTLSYWLRNYPLSNERIKELRDNSEQRIERYRETMRKKRNKQLGLAYNRVCSHINTLNKRDLFLTGLALYWGEGGKTTKTEVSISNTDPSVPRFFIKWLKLFDVDVSKLRVSLQLYSDMNENKEIKFWMKELSLKRENFRKSYFKKTSTKDISYKREFKHGTCNVKYGSRELKDYISMGLKRLQEISK